MTQQNASAEAVDRKVEDAGPVIEKIAGEVWQLAELSHEEAESARLLTDVLEENGFAITSRGTAGVPTAFVAEWGSGSPVLGFLPEYDALPGLGNEVVPRREPRKDGKASGHGCGHNLLGAGLVGAAVALKEAMAERGVPGTLRVYGCAAEETEGAKVYMAREGLFSDLDAALHWHPMSYAGMLNLRLAALDQVTVEFFGKTAHAGMEPWNGRSALHAAELFAHAVNMMREHVEPTARIHYVYENAGEATNIVPDYARLSVTVRDVDRTRVEESSRWIQQISEGAALATQTASKVAVTFGLYDLLPNAPLAERMQVHLERVGVPVWTEEEQRFARECQENFGAEAQGMATEVLPLSGESTLGASSDVADVSWNTPTMGCTMPTWPLGISAHTWPVVACGGTSIGLKGATHAAKVLAATGYEIMTDGELRGAARGAGSTPLRYPRIGRIARGRRGSRRTVRRAAIARRRSGPTPPGEPGGDWYTFLMEIARKEEHLKAVPTPPVTISTLLEKVRAYSPPGAEERIAEAYSVAHAAHRGQIRKSGEPFVYHPLATADILADLHLDATTIAAALLHDVLEDTEHSKEELAAKFGQELAEIVDGVTKLKRLPSGNLEEAQAESLRKMIVAMSRDVRVIIIKLADRLHNMRTLAYLKRETQLRKATETLEIYAPLAHRLGIYSVKWELEDLSFATLHPRRYEEIKRLVAARRGDREAFINGTAAELLRHLKQTGIEAEVHGRVKHFYSIYNKMVKRNKEFNEIYDLAGLRVVVDSVRDCYGTLGVIHSIWKPIPGRFKDYIAMPKFNMYQSLHTTVMSNEGKLLEIQIRTEEMDTTAEYGIAAHWMYKHGVKDSKVDRLTWLKSMMEWQKETTDSSEFMESLKGELIADEVFVFTPKGDVVSLPAGATPIDFAYHVHTEVGHRTIGAKVNGRIVPLDSELVSGDRVEIITGKSASPSRDWLTVVQSGRARNKIRQFFNKADREDNLSLGREKVVNLLKKQRIGKVPSGILEDVARHVNYPSPDDMLAAVGAGVLSAENVAHRISELVHPKEEEEKSSQPKSPALAPLPLPESGTDEETGVRVVGSSGILTRLARCCTPMPGDDIVGYVSLGRGVVVHNAGCTNARALKSRDPDRFVEVEWASGPGKLFTVELLVEALDRMHLLKDITATISDAGVNILSARVDTIEDRTALSRFAFKAGSVQHVEEVIRKIRSIPDVYDVQRVSRDGTPLGR